MPWRPSCQPIASAAALEALGEVDVVHRLAGAEDVAVAQEVAQAQLERVEPQPLREQVHGALATPRPTASAP